MNAILYETDTLQLVVSELRADMSYQREHTEAWLAARVGDNLDLNLLGMPRVSQRQDGTYWVIDGWGRRTLMMLSGLGDEKITCIVYHGLTVAEEARLFLNFQDAVSHLKTGKFRAQVAAGDRDAVSIDSVVHSRGMSVGKDGPMPIGSVDALYRVYYPPTLKGARPDILAHTLDVVKDAWGSDRHARHGAILTAVGWVLAVHDGKVKKEDLSRKLAGYTGGADRLLADSRFLIQQEAKTTLPNAVATKLIHLINKGKRTNKLPEWRRLQYTKR